MRDIYYLTTLKKMKNEMTNEQIEQFRDWAERVANTANDTDTNIRPIDIIHDIFGIILNQEHFLPRL